MMTYHVTMLVITFHFVALQEGIGVAVNEVLSFIPGESQKCLEVAIVDDKVALERTEELMFRLVPAGTRRYVLGEITTTLVQVIDDDGWYLLIIIIHYWQLLHSLFPCRTLNITKGSCQRV